MRFVLLLFAPIFSPAGAISAEANDNSSDIANSQDNATRHTKGLPMQSADGKFLAQAFVRKDACRDPDRILFSVDINDTITGQTYHVGSSPQFEILAFDWSSNGSSYTFVHDDNVFYVGSPIMDPILVTTRSENGMVHGVFDWVYNEEIFHRAQRGALWFSPSDKYLAYASRAANASRRAMMTTYSRENTYDYHYDMEYPKTGEKSIAEFSVSIWNVETEESITMEVQLKDRKTFHYLFGVSWVTLHGQEILVATWANRWQNETAVTILSTWENATCSPLYEHKYEPSQWASPEDYAKIVHSNSSIFFILPEARGDNAWQHIAKVDVTEEFQLGSVSFLPAGNYDIRSIKEYRDDEDIVVYVAQAPDPWNMHTYRTPSGPRSLLNGDQCLNCLPYPDQALSSLKASNFIEHPSPSQDYRNWTIETFLLPSGYEATVEIYHGTSDHPSVPVVLSVYGGPNSNKATEVNQYNPEPIGYGDHAIVYIDARGSGGRGWKYRSAIYGRLVTVEVEDTLEAMKMVLAKYTRLDKNRVGVHGWSYGGTLTTALVELAPLAFFKCASVGAPVTNFLNYDATYTERFMGDAPPSSYVDLTKDVEKFRNTSLLLIHGLRDDNVHFQNSALLIESLQGAEISFQLMVYPNQDHSGWTLPVGLHKNHLYESFFSTCFQ